MSSKKLNILVSAYKELLASGEVQTTYQSLVGIAQSLRTTFSKKYKGDYTVANVLHGYIDFTYFYLQNNYLKKHKLKFAVVLNHQHANFELWLLGQTKDIQAKYWETLKDTNWVDEHAMPEYAIFEVPLLSEPDFDDTVQLQDAIHSEFESLSQEILKMLEAHE